MFSRDRFGSTTVCTNSKQSELSASMSSLSLLVTELQVHHSLVSIPLSLTSVSQVTGQRDEEEIPRGPRGASCRYYSPDLSALILVMVPVMQAAEKSLALLRSSPEVTTNLASGVFRFAPSVPSFWARNRVERGTACDTELGVG